MSGPSNDWSEWSELWRGQPVVDAGQLGRAASRKRWRMRAMVGLELAASLGACVQCVKLMTMTTGRWHLWAMATLAFMAVLQWLYLHVRRGTWRASSCDVSSLMRLTRERAEAGIRLARINLWGTLLWTVLTVLVSLPELEPTRWQADPKLKVMLALQFGVNGPLIFGLVAFCIWYIRRQRMRIASIDELLKPDTR